MDNLKAELLFMMKSMQYSSTPVTPEFEIINGVCNALQVDYHDLKSRNRSNENAEARFIIFQLLRQHTHLSFKAIGELFNRDHSTAMYGVETFSDLVDGKNKAFLAKLRKVEDELPGMDFFTPDKYV